MSGGKEHSNNVTLLSLKQNLKGLYISKKFVQISASQNEKHAAKTSKQSIISYSCVLSGQ